MRKNWSQRQYVARKMGDMAANSYYQADLALVERYKEKAEYAAEEIARDQAAFEAKLRAEMNQPSEPVQGSLYTTPQPAMLHDLKLIFAGKAYFTLKNTVTGNRFTYRVMLAPENPQFAKKYFVAVLTGPENTTHYSYLGYVQADQKTYRHGSKSKISEIASSVLGFKWLLKRIADGVALPPHVEIWHSGHCCKCGKLLTVDESIKRGLGPDCASKM